MVDEVRQRQGSGSPLPDDTRSQMEGYFGADLGGVRVHDGGEAAALNRELNANAFTVGSDVFFAEGKYNPGSAEGRATLAHELTHVGQQGGFAAPAQGVQRAAPDDEPQLQTLSDPTIQREGTPAEEDKVQTLSNAAVQREGAPDEEDKTAVQALSNAAVQRAAEDDETAVQTLRDPAVQRQNAQPQDEEDQLKGGAVQREGGEEEEA
jgi:hypothetical protein